MHLWETWVLSVTEGARGAGEGTALRMVCSLIFPQLGAKITWQQPWLGGLDGLKGEGLFYTALVTYT